MPTETAAVRRLPDQPDLDHLRRQAKSLQRQVRAAEPDAIDLVHNFDPSAEVGADFTLTGAQLVIARSYGFAGWRRLREYIKIVNDYIRFPEPAPIQDDSIDPADSADRLLQLATLNYTRDRSEALAAGRELLARSPGLATANVYTMAATGAADRLAAELRTSPELVNANGGPFAWPPLLYLCYGRLDDRPRRSAVRSAQVLLEAGADPNAGFLWQGMPSPFTALTGVFGGGEQDQPAHQHAEELARLLLEAGADPNDNQVLYNRWFRPSNDHLRLLFDHGLGAEVDSPWRRRLGDHYPTVTQMITEQLRWAANAGMIERVRLLLDHGVDVDGRGYHPVFGDLTPCELAVRAGNREIATVLADHGADTGRIDPADLLLGACMAGDADGMRSILRDHPSAPQRLRDRWPDAVWRAADKGRVDGVRLLLELGLDPDVPGRFGTTALHQAAHDGRIELVDLLLDSGADPTPTDERFDSRPSGWAEHAGHHELAARLRAAEERRT